MNVMTIQSIENGIRMKLNIEDRHGLNSGWPDSVWGSCADQIVSYISSIGKNAVRREGE